MVKTPQKDKPTGKVSIVTPSISSMLTRFAPVIPRKKVRARLKKETKERIKEERRKNMTDTAAQVAALATAVQVAVAQTGTVSTITPGLAVAGGIGTVVNSNASPEATTSIISYVLKQNLDNLLRSVYDVQGTDSHEALEALSFANVKTWRQFMKLEDEDIDNLTKQAPTRSSIRATIVTNYKRELMSFQRMTTERKENNDPGAKDISSYKADDIDDYYDK